jgi:cystathionine gamma-lyase
MAATHAALESVLAAGGVLVAPEDGYPGVRLVATERWEPAGVEVRFVATDTDAILAALDGATAVWLETPSNPGLDVCDVAAISRAAHAAGTVVLVDNTLATPLFQRPLELGADVSMVAGTKALAGHSDLLLGLVTVRESQTAEALRRARSRSGAVPGPFEAWLAHRSLATLSLRLERQQANALALASRLLERGDVHDVRYPGLPATPRTRSRRARCAASGPSSASGSTAPTPRRRSSPACGWWPRRRASAACTPPRSAAAAGRPTRSRPGSSASPAASKTPRTCSRTSSARSTPSADARPRARGP